MEKHPPKGGAPQFSETGVPVYPQPGASAPHYNQAFPGQAGVPHYNQAYPAFPPQPGVAVVSVPPFNQDFTPGIPLYNQSFPPQAGVPSYNQPFPPQAGANPYHQAFPGQNYGASTEMEWSTDLFACHQDPLNCFITCLCPCITVGQIAEVLDRGTTSCAVGSIIYTTLICASAIIGVPFTFLYSYGFRTKLRSLYSLKEGGCTDCCLHCWCESCAICQEYRELKNRGADPALGWQGNVEKWNRDGLTMPPAVATGMYR